MPGSDFSVGVICSACLPLGSSATGPHCFQELLPVLWSDEAGRHSPHQVGCDELLAWAWANQALGLAGLLV